VTELFSRNYHQCVKKSVHVLLVKNKKNAVSWDEFAAGFQLRFLSQLFWSEFSVKHANLLEDIIAQYSLQKSFPRCWGCPLHCWGCPLDIGRLFTRLSFVLVSYKAILSCFA